MKYLSKVLTLFFVLLVGNTYAAITDGAFSVNQIFDVQYNWSGNTLNASNFIAPYDSNFQTVVPTAGQYFKFIDNGNGTHGLGLYNSDGTLARTIHSTGQITALGSGAIFYIGSGFFGNVITTSQGYSYGASAQFTNMDRSVDSNDLASYSWASTTPLASGQTASSVPVAPNYTAITAAIVTTVTPTSTNSPSGETANKAIDGTSASKYLNFDRANAGFTITLNQGRVISGVKFTTANDFEPRDPTKFSLYGSNDGVTWTEIAKDQSTTLNTISARFTQTALISLTNTNAYVYYFITFPSIKAIDSYGSVAGCQSALGNLACDSVQIAEVTYFYDSNNTTTSVATGTTIKNPGTSGAISSMNTTPTVISSSTTTQTSSTVVRGSSTVTSTTTDGTSTATTNLQSGITTSVTVETRQRGLQTQKTLNINQIFTTTQTTPITKTITTNTPFVITTVTTTPVTTTTVNTPITTETLSDGSTRLVTGAATTSVNTVNEVITTSTNGIRTTTDVSFYDDVQINTNTVTHSTKIDQQSNLLAANKRINNTLDSDVLNRFHGTDYGLQPKTTLIGNESIGWTYLINDNLKSSKVDSYNLNGTRLGVGHELKIAHNHLIGLQFNHLNFILDGANASGTLSKNHLGFYSLFNYTGWLIKTDVGLSHNEYTNFHNLPVLSLSNSGRGLGLDFWSSNRLYSSSIMGFRPFVGLRVESNKRDSIHESGSLLSAMTYDAVKQRNINSELGLRFSTKIADTLNLDTEVSENKNKLRTYTIAGNLPATSNVLAQVQYKQQEQDVYKDKIIQFAIKWLW